MAEMSIAEALRQAIREEMQRDPRVFCVGEDIGITGGFGGAFTVTLGLADEFGHERILDTPISEIGIAGLAIGNHQQPISPIMLFVSQIQKSISSLFHELSQWGSTTSVKFKPSNSHWIIFHQVSIIKF